MRLSSLSFSLLFVLACGASHGADSGVDSSMADSARPDVATDAGVDATVDSGASDSGLPACPTDLFAADGTPCPVDGQTCGDCPGDPCGFCNQLHCMSGTWSRIEAFPAPCHDCGSAGQCVSISEYCDHSYSDVGGVPDSFQCLPLPEPCRGDLSCTCLQANGVAGDNCSGSGTMGLTVEHFGG